MGKEIIVNNLHDMCGLMCDNNIDDVKGGVKMGEKIKEYRIKHLLTQRDFAEMCGLSVVTINQIERGAQEPSLLSKAKIERILEED